MTIGFRPAGLWSPGAVRPNRHAVADRRALLAPAPDGEDRIRALSRGVETVWWNHGTAWDFWPAMMLMMVVMVVVAVVVILAIQSAGGGNANRSADARRILDARLAKGEIDPDEYEVRREALSRSEQ